MFFAINQVRLLIYPKSFKILMIKCSSYSVKNTLIRYPKSYFQISNAFNLLKPGSYRRNPNANTTRAIVWGFSMSLNLNLFLKTQNSTLDSGCHDNISIFQRKSSRK